MAITIKYRINGQGQEQGSETKLREKEMNTSNKRVAKQIFEELYWDCIIIDVIAK